MQPRELSAQMQELALASAAGRKALWRRMQHATSQPWFDADWQAQLVELADRFGLSFQAPLPVPLGVGEAWVLLYERQRDSGLTGRLCFGAGNTADEQCAIDSRHALQDAFVALQGLAASKLRRLPAHVDVQRCAVVLPVVSGPVEGSSLGLTSAIALLSAALNQPAPSDLAATATLRTDGTLHPVQHLQAKVEALVQRHPEVKRVLVARGQPCDFRVSTAIELRECATLEDALLETALDISALEAATMEAFEGRLQQLICVESVQSHVPEVWLKLAAEAGAIGRALQADTPAEAARAFGHAALFALHAGRGELAKEFLGQNQGRETALSPVVTAWLSIVTATHMIDQATTNANLSFQDVIRQAREALAQAQLLAQSDQDRVLGLACGTLGRAYLHAGEAGQSIAFLEQGLAHHQRTDVKEAPRSATYLATALRHVGRVPEAIQTIRQALDVLDGPTRRALFQTTKSYAQLELGRCLLAAADASAALSQFQAVVDSQRSDEQHPRISALRGMAEAYRQLGDLRNAAAIRDRCARVACGSYPHIVRLLGAMALGDALVAGDLHDAAARQVWTALTGASDIEKCRTIVERWVY